MFSTPYFIQNFKPTPRQKIAKVSGSWMREWKTALCRPIFGKSNDVTSDWSARNYQHEGRRGGGGGLLVKTRDADCDGQMGSLSNLDFLFSRLVVEGSSVAAH